MKFVPRPIYFIALILILGQYSFAQNRSWEPVSQTELQMKTPQVEAEADAEVLFWEVRIVDNYSAKTGWESTLLHHLRVKTFTDRGREKNSKVDIPFGSIDRYAKIIVKDIAARTIKPDGSIVDGSLEGDIKIEFTGHLAEYYREYNDDDSPTEREKYLTETIKEQVGNAAEITNISIENLEGTEKPFVYSFKIRIPAYADRTGKRIFLRPNIFERNTGSLFTAGKRKYDVFFEYAWSEEDSINIELPKGYSPESADSPKAVKDEKTGASLESLISLSDDRRMLNYQRRFSFGNPGALVIYQFYYSGIKGLFESIHTADSHGLILREDSLKTD